MNIYDEIQKANIENQNKTAMILRHDDGRETSLTYKETFDKINTFCASLEKSGVLCGTRVAIIAESCPEWSIAYLSVVKINATAVLIDASLPPNEILSLINKSDAGCI